MNFFQQLHQLNADMDLTIRFKEKNGKYTLQVLPNIGSKSVIQPLIVTGTPEELDAEFFNLVTAPLLEAKASLANAKEFKESVDKTAAKETVEKKKPAKSKPASKKKPVKKGAKPVKKVVEKKAKAKAKETKPKDIPVSAPETVTEIPAGVQEQTLF
jgi:PRTRC genetic system protein E